MAQLIGLNRTTIRHGGSLRRNEPMIVAGQLLIDDGKGRCRIAPGYIRVDEEVIAEVVEGEIPDEADYGGSDALISPGFIDALTLDAFALK